MLDFECKNLQKVPLFKNIEGRALQLIAFAATRVSYQPGEAVFERGGASDAIYIVVEGEVDSFTYGDDGAERRLSRFGPGRSFGETSVLNDVDRFMTARAHTSATLLQISKTDFLELMREIPQFALSVARDLARRLDIMINKYASHPPD